MVFSFFLTSQENRAIYNVSRMPIGLLRVKDRSVVSEGV